jgi:hypothetical protein
MVIGRDRPEADVRAARKRSFKSIATTNEANQRRHGSDLSDRAIIQ